MTVAYTKPRMSLVTVCCGLVLATCFRVAERVAVAQQPSADSTAASSPVKPAVKTVGEPDNRYRIGPGDVLDIRVFNRPQLSRDAVRVDARGMIRMPFIDGEIQAACRTESELAQEIATRLLKYQRNPQVDVFVKDYVSRPVAVIGAVLSPGRFQLQRRVRLLELLTFVGGPSDKAGRSIQIIHAGENSLCEQEETASNDDQETKGVSVYNLSDTLRGGDSANPYIRAGDIVTLPEAEQVFVVGNVRKPSALSLREPLTISRAIMMAGGTMPDTKSDKIRVIRQAPGAAVKTTLYVDLKGINEGRREDFLLQANDIVDVPASTSVGKSILQGLKSTIIPTVANLPLMVIY
jgi:polysaccharide export outer membrane protein